jgi:hypothetical protein
MTCKYQCQSIVSVKLHTRLSLFATSSVRFAVASNFGAIENEARNKISPTKKFNALGYKAEVLCEISFANPLQGNVAQARACTLKSPPKKATNAQQIYTAREIPYPETSSMHSSARGKLLSCGAPTWV